MRLPGDEDESIEEEESSLHPHTKLWVFRIILLVAAALFVLSFFKKAGTLGFHIDREMIEIKGMCSACLTENI